MSIGSTIKGAGETVKNYSRAVISNQKAKNNLNDLASRYRIAPGTWGEKNYNTVLNKANKMANKGDMVGVRNYYKSQKDKAGV